MGILKLNFLRKSLLHQNSSLNIRAKIHACFDGIILQIQNILQQTSISFNDG